MDNKLFHSYKKLLAHFNFLNSKVENLFYSIEAGEIIDVNEAVSLIEEIADVKQKLMLVKKNLGFLDELAFLENSTFAGFRIEEGVVKGCMTSAFEAAIKWRKEFPDKFSNIYYEVSSYLLHILDVNVAVIEEKEACVA